MTFYVTHDLSFDVIFEKSLKMMMMTMKDKSKKRELDVLALKNRNEVLAYKCYENGQIRRNVF